MNQPKTLGSFSFRMNSLLKYIQYNVYNVFSIASKMWYHISIKYGSNFLKYKFFIKTNCHKCFSDISEIEYYKFYLDDIFLPEQK